MIKEMVSVLFSILLNSNMYPWMKRGRMDMKQVKGTDLNDLLDMIDNGQINEARISCWMTLITVIKGTGGSVAIHSQHLTEKKKDFLQDHGYSDEEIPGWCETGIAKWDMGIS